MENDVILNLALRQDKYWVTCACGCFLYRCAGGGRHKKLRFEPEKLPKFCPSCGLQLKWSKEELDAADDPVGRD